MTLSGTRPPASAPLIPQLGAPAPAPARLGDLDPHVARLFARLVREPRAVVAPQARAFGALMRGPGRRLNGAPAPAIFHQELGRRPRIEGRHLVVDVTAERRADHLGLAECQVIG